MPEFRKDYLHGVEYVRKVEKHAEVYLVLSNNWVHYVFFNKEFARQVAGGLAIEGNKVEIKTASCIDGKWDK